jgi:hypothetical protein
MHGVQCRPRPRGDKRHKAVVVNAC